MEPETISNRLQKLYQILFLRRGQAKLKDLVIVIHDIQESRGTAIMKTRRVLPERSQRRSAIFLRRAAIGIGRVHPPLGRIMEDAQIDVRIERRFVARRAAPSRVEHSLTPCRGSHVETVWWWCRLREAVLIVAQRRQLRLHQIRILDDANSELAVHERLLDHPFGSQPHICSNTRWSRHRYMSPCQHLRDHRPAE